MGPHRVDRQPLLRTTAIGDEPRSVVVCELVSQVAERSIRELPPLANAIDPDALDAVFRPDGADGSLAFEYAEFDVIVRSNGAVEVYPLGTATE